MPLLTLTWCGKMGTMTSLGAVCWPAVPPELLRDVAVAADEAGLDELWLWEDCFWGGGVAACAAALAWTSRIRVGIGVLPVPLRNVALAAMETALLCRMFPDRAIIGVGHGVQDWMGQAGVKAESPMTLLREYLPALRALLRGEKVSASGRYVHLDEVALVWPAVPGPPALASAPGQWTRPPRKWRARRRTWPGLEPTASSSSPGSHRPRRAIPSATSAGSPSRSAR